MDFFSRPDVHSQTSTCIYSLPIPFFIFTFFEMFKTSFILIFFIFDFDHYLKDIEEMKETALNLRP